MLRSSGLQYLILITILFSISCSSRKQEVSKDLLSISLSDSLAKTTTAENIRLTLYRANKAAVYLRSPSASTYELNDGTTQTLFSGGVLVTLIDSLGNEMISSSNSVFYKSPESIFSLKDEVIIRGVNNRILRTDDLFWDHKNNSVRTEGYVIMVTQTDSIRGYGLRANTDLSDYSIKNITGSTTINRSKD
jgi:LPS export ABC transporter protein LptC